MEFCNYFPPGALGDIIGLHSRYYASSWGFGTFFEAKVARELAGFADRASGTDLILIAHDAGVVKASLILDLNDPQSGARGAHLRWFICSQDCRGTGVGRSFMARAVAHAEQHSGGRMWLTTFAGLHSARHLYENFGFTLAVEAQGDAWGTTVTEQEFRR
ncbi:Acetyltransferase (GNAT) family protein [Shimia thalassica]|uniref:Acetyltransferase (GNAT) family protein n=1 Tax=Shimia thalassica TaxID=1715693 RepID=A0A0N7M9D5_9RHOB|nr:GNAT family N-acetyltransferase [Shimia thalassica]CUJ98127.1 Acetyltransferase (GNAT) family protein [Shimia thalassica]